MYFTMGDVLAALAVGYSHSIALTYSRVKPVSYMPIIVCGKAVCLCIINGCISERISDDNIAVR